MQIEFDEVGHVYRLNGNVLPSVTQVLDPLMDFTGISAETLEAARRFGQNVHEACHLVNRGELEWATLDDALVPFVLNYKRFLEESGAIVVASELVVVSERYEYAGKLDCEAILGNSRAVIDIKSSATVPRTVGPQTAAYERARSEMRRPSAKRFCLQLSTEGYKLHPLTNPADFSMFLSALNVWRYFNAA